MTRGLRNDSGGIVADILLYGIIFSGTAGLALVKVSLLIRMVLTPLKRLTRDGGLEKSGPLRYLQI